MIDRAENFDFGFQANPLGSNAPSMFSGEEKQKLTQFFQILASIDQRLKKEGKLPEQSDENRRNSNNSDQT